MSDIFLNEIEEYSKSLGFQDFKVTNFKDFSIYSNNLREFIKNKFYGEMGWIKEKSLIRENPKNIWLDAKSALVFGLNYGPATNPLLEIKNRNTGYISIYARRKDYHKVIKTKLKSIGRFISNNSDIKVKVFVDTAPIMEKPLAELSNMGWIGKHTNLVSKKYGSWLFLGIILTNYSFKKIKKDKKNNCGSCKACNEVCPTNAFISPYKLDARKCISYLTIEHKSHIKKKYRPLIGNRIFGCDDCLAVCPWNKFARTHSDIKLDINKNLVLQPLKSLVNLDEESFRKKFSGTPVRRLGYDRFLRNILIAIGNSGDKSLVESTVSKLEHNSNLVRAMAVWALFQLSINRFKEEKKLRFEREKDSRVREEWNIR
ncbi:MAG: tRNA epoxyqueuosine(34) reductase QueG [Alphaproteobacteria bacterium TMED93]|nr:MAG: tRNA epoxyqueuosine(34) reductase QueG [Alphaproteobacteria bacterium TMED93]|tara:strand:- start:857 stop:1972 length:1116 start_codon:yes stop_codon:yes gene_type:complete